MFVSVIILYAGVGNLGWKQRIAGRREVQTSLIGTMVAGITGIVLEEEGGDEGGCEDEWSVGIESGHM